MARPTPDEAHGVGGGQSGSDTSRASSSDPPGLVTSSIRVLTLHAPCSEVSDWKVSVLESGDHERPLEMSGPEVANCQLVVDPVTRFRTTIASGAADTSVNVRYASSWPLGLTAGS